MTVRRWILTGLFQAGIDVTKYSARTTRHASSSRAVFAGVNVDSVLQCAGWYNISSFVTHYNLPIEQKPPGKVVSYWEKNPQPKVLFFSKCNIKTAKNVRAQQILTAAK